MRINTRWTLGRFSFKMHKFDNIDFRKSKRKSRRSFRFLGKENQWFERFLRKSRRTISDVWKILETLHRIGGQTNEFQRIETFLLFLDQSEKLRWSWKIVRTFVSENFEHRSLEMLFELSSRYKRKITSVQVRRRFSSSFRKFFICFFREKMIQAYDHALNKIGLDVYAYTIYNDYIHFLRQV